jgi:membrane-associated phospholipid phosphatase
MGTLMSAGDVKAVPVPDATLPAKSDPKASDTRDAPAALSVPALSPTDGLGRNAAESFWGWNLALHLTAVGQTALVSGLDVDYEVRQTFHRHTGWGRAAYPAVILGVVGPVGVISGLFAKGYWGKDQETLGAAYAVLQANALTLGYVTMLKLITGRPPPHDDLVGPVAPDMRSLSHTFRFGVGRGGIFHGWPSGHVAATMATCSSLAAYYPDSWALKLVGAASVAYMMFGVTSFQGGSMHWFSEAIAGALMTYPTGVATGKGFRRMQQGRAPARDQTVWVVLPSFSSEATLITAARRF